MAIKVGNKIVGESPGEQYTLERKRFEAKQKRLQELKYSKEEEFLRMGEGNKKLTDYMKENLK